MGETTRALRETVVVVVVGFFFFFFFLTYLLCQYPVSH